MNLVTKRTTLSLNLTFSSYKMLLRNTSMRTAAILEIMRKTVKSLWDQIGLSDDRRDMLPISEPILLLLLLALRLLGPISYVLVDLKFVPYVAPIEPYLFSVAALPAGFFNPLFPYGRSSASTWIVNCRALLKCTGMCIYRFNIFDLPALFTLVKQGWQNSLYSSKMP